MVRIIWKNNTTGILVLILIVAATFTFLGVPNNKFIAAQSNNRNITNSTQPISPSPAEIHSESPAITPFALSSGASALQSNNIVSTRVAYDIIFRPTSAGVVKSVEMTFPAGTNVRNATVLEVSGIGRGTTSINGQVVIYSVNSPVNIPINANLRFEIWNIVNAPTPNSNLAVKITTKNSTGTEIETVASTAYSIKQITRGDIATDAVTADKIAGVSKLIFRSCDGNPTPIAPREIITVQCSVPGAALEDNVLITTPFICRPTQDQNPDRFAECLETLGGRVSNADVVSIYIRNNIMPATPFNTGSMKFSIMVFKP